MGKVSDNIIQLKKLELANILNKLKEGKTLANSEQRRLDELQSYFEQIEGSEKGKVKWGYFAEGDVILSSGGLSNILGYSARHVNRFKEAGCPQERRGWWSLKTVLQWLRENNQGHQVHDSRKIRQLLEEAELRWKNAKADNEEIQVRRQRRDLLSREEIKQGNQLVIKNSQNRLRSIATKAAPFVLALETESEIQEYLLQEIDQVLAELANLNEIN